MRHLNNCFSLELPRMEYDAESLGLPRCSSFGSNNTRLAASSSHQQLTGDYCGDSHYSGGGVVSGGVPPQKKPRRHRASSSLKPLVTSSNGLVSSASSATIQNDKNDTADESTKGAGFTMGGRLGFQ